MSRPRLIALALVALAVFTAACSGGQPSPRGAQGSSEPAPAPSISPTKPIAGGTGNPLATRSSTALPRATDSPGAVKECRGRTVPSQRSGVPGTTYIRAAPTVQQGWGKGCESLNAGDACVLKWNGAFTIASDSKGFIEFQGWAKGADAPFDSLRVPVGDSGQFRRWEFPVRIPKTDEVAFQALLLDSRKIPIAIGDAFIYPVDCGAK